jgi:hypothetical protein
MSAQDTERAAALERRYRRLLRCYPPGHRQVHREEMLGVLLATARPGQRAPGARQTVNLVACGLAIRARRALRSLADESWQDALAVVSLITPVLMLIISALGFAVEILEAVVEHHAYPAAAAGPFWQPWLVPFLGGPAAAMIGWLAVVLLGLTGRRRAAAAIASIALAPALFNLLAVVIQQSGAWSGGLPMFLITAGVDPVVMASLAACSLGFSAGPRRGLAIAGRRRVCLMIAVLSVVFGFTAVVYLVKPSASLTGSGFTLLGVLALAVAVVVTRVRGTVGWRASPLVAAPAFLLDAVSIPFAGSLTATAVLSLGNLLLAVLVWPVAIASWRGRVRRSSHALPT